MLEQFTVETFAGRLGETFHIHLEAAPPLEMRLIEARALSGGAGQGAAGAGRRAPFSIVFRGPRAPLLPQRIYRLEHGATGAFELFLVPIGPDGEGLRYEAIFT